MSTNYESFFEEKLEELSNIKKSEEGEKLENICWYAAEEEENPFPSYLIDTEDYKLNNLDFIAKLKEIITNCFEIYNTKFIGQKYFLWDMVDKEYIFQYNLFRSLLLEYLMTYVFSYLYLKNYEYSPFKIKKKILGVKLKKIGKTEKTLLDLNNIISDSDAILEENTVGLELLKNNSPKTEKKSRGSRISFSSKKSTVSKDRRSSAPVSSKKKVKLPRYSTPLPLHSKNSTSSKRLIYKDIPSNAEEYLIAAGSTNPSSDYDVTLDIKYIDGYKINLIINYAFKNFMLENNEKYKLQGNQSLGKLFDSNIYSHKTLVDTQDYQDLKHYFLPLKGKSFLLPMKFIEGKDYSIFIREEIVNCFDEIVPSGQLEINTLKKLLVNEINMNIIYNEIVKFFKSKKKGRIQEPIEKYKNLVGYLHTCLKYAVEVYEGISTIYHVVFALQMKDEEAIKYFTTNSHSYRVSFVSAVDNLIHLYHLMNSEDYKEKTKDKAIINSKNVKYVARILHAYKLCETKVQSIKGGSSKIVREAQNLGNITRKRTSMSRVRNRSKSTPSKKITPKKFNSIKSNRTIVPSTSSSLITPTDKSDTFFNIGSYDTLMRIKNEENPDLSDFNLPGFNAIKIFIIQRDDYLKIKERFENNNKEIKELFSDDIRDFFSKKLNNNIRFGAPITISEIDTIYSDKNLLEYLKYKILNLYDMLPSNNIFKLKDGTNLKDLIDKKLVTH